jgi:hypothetical protein
MRPLLVILEALSLAAPAISPAGDSAELAALLSKAQEVQVADTAGWTRFRFRRESLREELDDSGAVFHAESRIARIVPRPAGFDEELLDIDGREPTPGEVDSYRRAGHFQKHYKTFLNGEGEGEAGGRGYSLGDLLRMSSYRYEGEETVKGILCHRLEFAPGAEKVGSGLAGKFTRAMAGTLWITVDGLHLFRARAWTVKPISIAFSLVKIYDLRLEMESAAVEGGLWLPRRISLETHQRIVFSTSRRRTLYRYLDYEKAVPDVS